MPVTIVIPVYGQPSSVARAIDSVVRYGNLKINKLIVVNDFGPNSARIRLIVRKAMMSSPRIEYVENDENIGFGRTCNRAVFELDQTLNNVLLLNSDAELTDCALQEMQDVLDASPRHASVSPRTNNGTIATIPLFPRKERTREETRRFFDEHRNLLPQYSIAPVSPGFCMLIRREVVRTHGLFDEVFSPGYEEENDFCLRVNSIGLSSVLANHAFVWHGGSASFGTRRRTLADRHAILLRRRYPFYSSLIENYVRSRVNPVDKFLDYLDPADSPSILIDCSALTDHLNGTVRNILSFLDFLTKQRSSRLMSCRFTLLVSRTMTAHYGLDKLGFGMSFMEDRNDQLFDVGFAISPIWSFEALELLISKCSRIASLHLDIIALRSWEINAGNPSREQAVYAAAEWADVTIFISNSARTDFFQLHPHAHLRDNRVIHQGVILKLDIVGHEMTAKLGEPKFIGSGEGAVLVLGNGFKHKQVDRAIAALAGERFEVIALSDHHSSKGIVRTVQSGVMSDQAVQELFDSADVIVFPSAYEGFGLPIGEAIRAGKPFIAYDTDTAREVVALLGGSDSTLFFRQFDQLPALIRSASGMKMDVTGDAPRTSDQFNGQVLAELISLAERPVDPNFLRQRVAVFGRLRPREDVSAMAAQLGRRSARWALKFADTYWGPIRRRIYRS